MRSTVLPALVITGLCAPATPGFPMYFSVEYTGDAALGAFSFDDVLIRAEAKGTTDDITTSVTAQGPLHRMPVSMAVTIAGFGSVDIASDMWCYSYSDFGVVGFAVSENQPALSFVSTELTGFDLTTSAGPMALLGLGGHPGGLLFTPYGLLVFQEGDPAGASFTAVAANPAPGVAAPFALAGVLVVARRRRSGASG